MVQSSQIIPGMIVSIGDKLYQVESCMKVTATKGTPFIKTKIKDLVSGKTSEKNFKPTQSVKEVSPEEKLLEFLYMEGEDFLFLDINNLEQILVPKEVIEDKVNYLKGGIELKASFYGEMIFTIELPQFLELMVSSIEEIENVDQSVSSTVRLAILETGAKVEVPPFVEPGDILKVDPRQQEFIQRV